MHSILEKMHQPPRHIICHHFFLTPCRVRLSVCVKAQVKPGFKTEDNKSIIQFNSNQ